MDGVDRNLTNNQEPRFDISKSTRPAHCQNCRQEIPRMMARLRYRNNWKTTRYYVSKHLCLDCLIQLCAEYNKEVHMNPTRRDSHGVPERI